MAGRGNGVVPFPHLSLSFIRGIGAAGFGSLRSPDTMSGSLRVAARRSQGRSVLLFVAPTSIKEVAAPFKSCRCAVKEIGAAGFEPATYWSQTSRSTKLSHAPIFECKNPVALLPRFARDSFAIGTMAQSQAARPGHNHLVGGAGSHAPRCRPSTRFVRPSMNSRRASRTTSRDARSGRP